MSDNNPKFNDKIIPYVKHFQKFFKKEFFHVSFDVLKKNNLSYRLKATNNTLIAGVESSDSLWTCSLSFTLYYIWWMMKMAVYYVRFSFPLFFTHHYKKLRNVVITVKLREFLSWNFPWHLFPSALTIISAKNRMGNVKMTHSTRLVRCEITSSLQHHITNTTRNWIWPYRKTSHIK